MFVFWNPCARAKLHQHKRALKLCSATLSAQKHNVLSSARTRTRIAWYGVEHTNILTITGSIFVCCPLHHYVVLTIRPLRPHKKINDLNFLLKAYLTPEADLPFTAATFLVTWAFWSRFMLVGTVFIRDFSSVFNTAPYITWLVTKTTIDWALEILKWKELICGWNPNVWPFKWKLLRSAFIWAVKGGSNF